MQVLNIEPEASPQKPESPKSNSHHHDHSVAKSKSGGSNDQ